MPTTDNKPTELWILHGWSVDPNNQEKWQPLMDLLSKNNVVSHFLSIPGLDQKLDRPWTLDNYLDWLKKTLPQEPVNLLGHSFGGQLLVKFSGLYPDRVARLTLIAPAGIRDHSTLATAKRKFFKNLTNFGKKITTSENLRKVLYKLLGERDYLQADPILRQTMSAILESEISDDIRKIKNPTLLIWGKRDRSSPYKFSNFYQEKLEKLTFLSVKEARHSPQFTHTREVARAVSSFLRGATE